VIAPPDSDQLGFNSEQRVYQLLAILPSESTIHFFVYCSLVFLALLFTIGTPAVAILFAEHRPLAGTLFVATNLAIFCFSFVVQFRRNLEAPQPSRVQLFVRFIVRKLQEFYGMKGAVSRFAIRPGPSFRVFPVRSGIEGFFDFYEHCWHSSMGKDVPAPRLYWSYQERMATARVAGLSRNPIVAISAGLVSLFPKQAEVARVYLLHEFGHIFNQDLEVFAFTLAGSRACRAALLSSSLISGLLLLPFLSGGISSALILLVATMWVLLMAALWLLLARYAGVIVSLRELYADVQAVIWLPGLGAFKTVLIERQTFRFHRRWSKLRSLVSLRLIHLSPDERLSYLERPESLLYPRHGYYLLVALLLVALQSNPFGEGYDNNWMRWSVLLAWSPVGLAYLMNVGRAIMGFALLPNRERFTSIAGLSLGVTAVLILPMLRIPGIYGDVLLSLGNWDSFRSSTIDSAKTMAAQWGHIQYVGVPILAAIWLSVSYSLARLRLQHIELMVGKEVVAKCDRSFLFISGMAVLAETILLAIQDYSNTAPTWLDSWQASLDSLKAASPILGLCVLLFGSLWVWRARRLNK
jgi:hypothetical protein